MKFIYLILNSLVFLNFVYAKNINIPNNKDGSGGYITINEKIIKKLLL